MECDSPHCAIKSPSEQRTQSESTSPDEKYQLNWSHEVSSCAAQRLCQQHWFSDECYKQSTYRRKTAQRSGKLAKRTSLTPPESSRPLAAHKTRLLATGRRNDAGYSTADVGSGEFRRSRTAGMRCRLIRGLSACHVWVAVFVGWIAVNDSFSASRRAHLERTNAAFPLMLDDCRHGHSYCVYHSCFVV